MINIPTSEKSERMLYVINLVNAPKLLLLILT